MAGESLHPHAGKHQVNFERGCGYRRGFVDHEYFWAVSFTFQNPHWDMKDDLKEPGKEC
jgi:hypothetical protein